QEQADQVQPAEVHLSRLRHLHQKEAARTGRPQPPERPAHHHSRSANHHFCTRPGAQEQPQPPSIMLPSTTELADLHIQVGGAVAPHILWSLAHEHGFKLPVKTYWEFRELVTADPNKVHSLGEYLEILHRWTEKIQSSPHAIERSVYEIIGKEYRASN